MTSNSPFPIGPRPILPPATIGILGGGQLGRMLGFAARAMGYRLAILDPDPDCPAAAVADRVVIGTYDDVGAALRLADISDVVTYELEHVAAEVVEAVEAAVPVRPGRRPLVVTQDRLAERRFVESDGIAVAPWREVRTIDELRAAAAPDALGLPLRLKVPIGGYDGRGQVRLTDPADVEDALARLGRAPGSPVLAERELDFVAELSIIVTRGLDGSETTFPIARNHHEDGVLRELVAPAPFEPAVAVGAREIGRRLATGMDLVGTLTAELFLLADGSLVVNELAPRVHNSGHWTIEGAATSQFEQHVRAICGLDLARPTPWPRRRWSTSSARVHSGRRVSAASPMPSTTRGPPPPLRQATRLRRSQDGASHGARVERRRRARVGATGAGRAGMGRRG